MANARDIKKRMKAVGNIRRITKTMQMIATSKFAKAQTAATASKPYTEGIFELVTELAEKAGNISHPLINGPTGGAKGPEVLLVLSSDRGLCGPYNGSVLRAAMGRIRASGEKNDSLQVENSGKKGAGFFKFNQTPIAHQHSFGDTPRYEEIERLAQRYMDEFVSGKISGVRVVYMRYLTVSRQRPETLQLLPLRPPTKSPEAGVTEAKATAVQYDITPEPEKLLADLLPVTVKTTLFQCFTDSIVSEHVARMIAMKSATDNAGKMGKSLQRRYNRARQSQITTELTEIISGAAALE
jgi:F-type H+-transporting ATPase subunit gamma